MLAMLDPGIKIRHLVAFLEVARLRSFNKAAAVLAITQPAVSKTIRELEAVLGIALVDRAQRRFELTPFGRVFLRYAGTSVAALRQGMEAVAEAKGSEVLTVTIGALPTVSARILPEAVRHFMDQGLPARARVVTGPNDYLIAQLRLGDVDFVVGRMAEADVMMGLGFENLYFERVVFVVRAGHPLLAAEPFDMAALASYPVLIPPPGSIIRPSVDRLLMAHGLIAPRNAVETVSTAFGRSYVAETDAVWIISEGVVARDLDQGSFTLLPLDTSGTLGPVGLTTRTDMPLSVPAQVLAEAIRAVARRQAGIKGRR